MSRNVIKVKDSFSQFFLPLCDTNWNFCLSFVPLFLVSFQIHGLAEGDLGVCGCKLEDSSRLRLQCWRQRTAGGSYDKHWSSPFTNTACCQLDLTSTKSLPTKK